MTMDIRHDWTVDEAQKVYDTPLLGLMFRAQELHRAFQPQDKVQLCTLLSIKTGACPEDCSYCPQSARYTTGVKAERLMPVEEVLACARRAKEAGASRFCMGAAWRSAKKGPQWDSVLAMVRGVRELGMEACLTAGMLSPEQAEELKAAGLSAYNHNIDTSKEFYGEIITTRTFEDRINTLQSVQKAGISACSGGIIGMGETVRDRLGMLVTLAGLNPHPGSVPINALVPVPGTPLADAEPVDSIEFVRLCAVARILMPRAVIRLSAGRTEMNRETQLLCFLAGANSIFYGDALLTTANPYVEADLNLFKRAGIKPLVPADAEQSPSSKTTESLTQAQPSLHA